MCAWTSVTRICLAALRLRLNRAILVTPVPSRRMAGSMRRRRSIGAETVSFLSKARLCRAFFYALLQAVAVAGIAGEAGAAEGRSQALLQRRVAGCEPCVPRCSRAGPSKCSDSPARTK